MKIYLFLGTLIFSSTIGLGQVINKSQSVGNTNKGSADLLKIRTERSPESANFETSSADDEINVHSVVIVSKLAPKGVNINQIPLFGGYIKSEEQLVQDQLFLNDCDREFPSREEAANFFNRMAWQYLNDGDRSTAVYRFNLSYLLNSGLYDNFWGLGVIEYQEGNLSNAIDLMSAGLDLTDGSDFVFMTDLATIYLKQAILTKNPIYETGKARELLQKAIGLQPNYAGAYTQMAIVKLLENKPEDAWNNFHKSLELNPADINKEVLSELLSRMEDPKGIFKKN